MYILGISAYYHDSAACLIKDGAIVFAAQEERYTRKKHDDSFPTHAVQHALDFAGITIDDVEIVAFYEKPFLKFERIIETYAANSPSGFWSFRRAMKAWFSRKIWVSDVMRKELGFKGEMIFSEHHEAHAASTFFTSPFEEATVLTIDGVGERATASIAHGVGNKLTVLQEQQFPHSLGLFYSAFTYFCGFRVNSGEYKLMGLAPYGKPLFVDQIREHFIAVRGDGTIELNRKHFNFEVGSRMLRKSAESVLGVPRRLAEAEMTQVYMDIAASVQVITEEAVEKMALYAIEKTGSKNLCLAGGVALNCKSNGELIKNDQIDGVWVQPASGDSGGALGAALVAWYGHLKKERIIGRDETPVNAYLGNTYSQEEVKSTCEEFGVKFHAYDEKRLAEAFMEKKVVGWYQGRMEYGPRALGNRSILASPLFEDMKRHVNLKIKMREGFRPFAPMVKQDKAKDWFKRIDSSKYMLFTYESDRSNDIPSCIHEDHTARVQTIEKSDNGAIYSLLSAFEERSGCPVLINTSFNVRGEPIVESPEDALKCFFQTGMDILVMEGVMVTKEDNPNPSEVLTKKNAIELD